MSVIIPRWEWRTFGHDFTHYLETLKKYGDPSIKRTSEVYILSKVRDDNTKIREDLIDIKALQAINNDNLEQWYPTLKSGFPITTDKLSELFQVFGVEAPIFEREQYTYDEFLTELIIPNELLKIVNVKKVRYIYTINGCAVEYAETEFNSIPWKTACVEHVDPKIVMKTVLELGLGGLPNINYIRAMKQSVGLA